MANEPSKTPTQAKPQSIPLSKIHELPGVFNPKPQDRTLGSMVLSIQNSGVKEPVILRQRDDGEYQLLSGYRRRRASELAKLQEIPAHVYEMTMNEAINYRKAVKNDPSTPIPGKFLDPNAERDKAKDNAAPAAPGDKAKEDKAKDGAAPTVPGDKAKEDKAKDGATPTAPGDKAKEDKAKEGAAPAAPGDKAKEDKAKEGASPAAPGDKAKEDKAKEGAAPAAPGDKAKEDKAKEGAAPAAPGDKAKEDKAKENAAPVDKAKEDKAKESAAPAAPGDKVKEDKAKDGTAPAAPGDKAKEDKAKDGTAPAAPGDKAKEDKAKEGAAPTAPGDKAKEDKAKDGTAPAAPGDKAKEDKAKEGAAPAAPGDKTKDKATPTVAELEAKAKAGERISVTDLANAAHAEKKAQAEQKAAPAAPGGKAKEDKAKEKAALTVASEGPTGTSITQIFEKRLAPPDEASLKTLPTPKEGESYFITLHPAYMEKSAYNNFSVDTESENFKELLKSVELVGIKDPVLARFNDQGKLEILSGQRRHLAATMLNQAVPTIIQKIGDADAKIMVADGNLHRDKISSYDLSRALRMKMEGMKQKAGRRKKGFSANELQSDAKLAQEMGMTVSKLNRLIRMSEAVKEVCDLVDDGRLTVSVAAEISGLKPKTQENVVHLLDLGYKATNERISRMKKAEAKANLSDIDLRNILDDKDIAPKQQEQPKQPENPATPSAGPTTESPGAATNEPPIPASPDVHQQGQTVGLPSVPPAPETPAQEGAKAGESPAAEAEGKDDPFKGGQERPEVTKVILTGDRLRKYFPDVSMTPREIEESVYSALEERRQRQLKQQQKAAIFKGPSR